MRVLLCTGDLVEGACPHAQQSWVEVNAAFTPGDLGITAAGVTEVAGWGVGVVLLLWSLGYGVGAALKMIRLA